MNTKEIQKYFLNYLKTKPNFLVLTTNYSWDLLFEADVFQITKDRDIVEFEIKTSRGDFLKDKLKNKKIFVNGKYETILKYDFLLGETYKGSPHYNLKRPNYFYYVTHSNLISKSEIHPSFGIIKVLESGQVFIEKRAKRLHNNKNADDKMVIDVSRNFCLKQCSL